MNSHSMVQSNGTASGSNGTVIPYAAGMPSDMNPFRPGENLNILAAAWRYRWAVILPTLVGMVVGFLVYLQMSETYRSTTRLIIETDHAAILDALTGELRGGVPGIEVVESQLFSDRVIRTAFLDPAMANYREQRFPGGIAEFAERVVAKKALKVEPEVTDVNTAQSLVMLVHFDSPDPDFSEVAVKAFSDALQQFYNEKYRSSNTELVRLIEAATQKLYPEMQNTERDYQEFRRSAKLAWDPEGKAINPHRQRQLYLVERRSELVEKLRQVATEHAAVKQIMESAEDPQVALIVAGQLLDKQFNLLIEDDRQKAAIGQDDEQLALVRVEERLVPLMVQRNQFISKFGPEHQAVKSLDTEIDGLRSELSRLSTEQAKRIKELLSGSDVKRRQAAGAGESIVRGLSTQTSMLSSQIAALDEQIEEELQKATQLAEAELENEAFIRRMDRQHELMDKLGEQLAGVRISEEKKSETRVEELTAPTRAEIVSPVLIKNLAIGGFLGLMLGGGLAFLLEKNANTFRDPEDIAQHLGVPVLAHVPFFKGRIKRVKKGETNPFQDLDQQLAVLHAPSSVASEAIRSLRTSLLFETSGPGGKVIQITSPLPGDGKSTVMGNLACSIAQSGKRVLAIDCDLRRPQLTDNFGMGNRLGLTNVLNGECEPAEAIHRTPLATLDVMPSGPVPANPADALTLPDMSELLDVLRDRYDYVLMDTPPLLVVTDPSITASMTDGVILTLRVRRKSKPNAKESINILRTVGARIFGVVINNSDESSSSDGYQGYGHYRYGRYTTRYSRRQEGVSRPVTGVAEATRRATPVVVSGRKVGALDDSGPASRPEGDEFAGRG